MINSDYPCKTCGHTAVKHYSNIADASTVCIGCYDSRIAYDNEQHHPFVGDNLKYMELLNKREEIRNEQA